MLKRLEGALNNGELVKGSHESISSRRQVSMAHLLLCSLVKNEKTEEERGEIIERIEELRQLEKEHKDEAAELFLQFGGEVLTTGVSAATGVEIIAVIEGVQATRHFVEGCREYNDGVGYQEMADKLEKELCSDEEEPVKQWWEFWK
jgi:hypothetical protein